MNAKRVYLLLISLIGILVLAMFGTTYEINNLLVARSNTLLGLKTKLSSLDQEQTELSQAKKDIKTYASLYDISKLVVPQNKDQAQTVRQIVNLAQANNVVLQSISFPTSTLGGTTTTSTSTSPASATPTTSTAASSAGAALSQLQPVPKIPGVYNLQIVVSSSADKKSLATYPELIGFLSALEQNRLTALVNAIAISPAVNSDGTVSTGSGQLSFSLTLDVYIKPGSTK